MAADHVLFRSKTYARICSDVLKGMGNLKRIVLINSLFLVCMALTSCGTHSNSRCIPIEHPVLSALGSPAPVLLFIGTGTSPCDVAAMETLLESGHINYATVNSPQLNGMGATQLREYQLLIIPGGNFIDMGKSLTVETGTNIREAVHGGMNYFGICAGAFLAGNSSYYNGFNLTSGVKFGFYSAADKGLSKTVATVTDAEGKSLDQYWENGPQLSGWGSVIGKYPDGTPAVVQGASGKGWVVLTGIHAEAPEGWRINMSFTTPASIDNAYAGMLIRAALNKVVLKHY